MPRKTQTASERFNDFWFAPQRTEALSFFRIVFGLYLLFLFFVSIPNWQRFYGPEGLYPYWLFQQSSLSFAENYFHEIKKLLLSFLFLSRRI